VSKKKKSKKMIVIINISKPLAKDYKKVPLGLSLRKAFKRVVKGMEQHFKEDGWDLDANHQFSDALYEVFDTHLCDLFMREAVGSGVASWGFKDDAAKNRAVFSKIKKRPKTNKQAVKIRYS